MVGLWWYKIVTVHVRLPKLNILTASSRRVRHIDIADNFSFLVPLGCPSGRFDLRITLARPGSSLQLQTIIFPKSTSQIRNTCQNLKHSAPCKGIQIPEAMNFSLLELETLGLEIENPGLWYLESSSRNPESELLKIHSRFYWPHKQLEAIDSREEEII